MSFGGEYLFPEKVRLQLRINVAAIAFPMGACSMRHLR